MPQPTSEHYLLYYTSDRCLRFSKSPLPHPLRPEVVGGERDPPNIYHLGAVGMGMEDGGISPGYIRNIFENCFVLTTETLLFWNHSLKDSSHWVESLRLF